MFITKNFQTINFFWLDGIISTMRSKAGPSYRVLSSLADYEKYLEHNDHSIIGLFFIELKRENKILFSYYFK